MGTIRSGPAGPQERLDWLKALIDVKERLKTRETSNRTLAQKAAEHDQNFKVTADEIAAYKTWMSGVIFHDNNSVENKHNILSTKVDSVMSSSAEIISSACHKFDEVDPRLAKLEQAFESLSMHVAGAASSAAAAPQQFRMHTPHGEDVPGNHGDYYARMEAMIAARAGQPDPWQQGTRADPWQSGPQGQEPNRPPFNGQLPRPAQPGAPLEEDDLLGMNAPVDVRPAVISPFGQGQRGPSAERRGPPMPESFAHEPAAPMEPSPFDDRFQTPPTAAQRAAAPPPQYNYQQCPAGRDHFMPMPGGANINVGGQYVAPRHDKPHALTFEVDRKKNESLKKFSGNVGEYQMWRDRMLDHLCRTNRKWRSLLETMQTWNHPIRRDWLLTQSECGFSGWEIAQILEAFLVEWLSDGLYRRRVQLCGGEKGNGIEMWRWLYAEFQGGSDAVRLGGARRLQEWTRCNKMESLSAHLDDWVECLQTHCAELLAAPGILRTMILGVIPSEFEDELLAKPHIKTWQEIVQWCKIKTVYKRQNILAEAARRPGGGRVNSVLAYVESSDQADGTPAQAPDESEPPAWFKDYISKLGPRPGGGSQAARKPASPAGNRAQRVRMNFEGCWHCGIKRALSRHLPGFPEDHDGVQ